MRASRAVSTDSYPFVSGFQLDLHPVLTLRQAQGKCHISSIFSTCGSHSPSYTDCMFDVGDSLRDAVDAARGRLEDAQAAVARANSGVAAGRSADAAMAQTAQAAIFTEALLGVERARFEEIKGVAK